MSRVSDIRYVGYGVTAFDAEREFYLRKWGLEEVAGGPDVAWLKTQGHDEHHVVRLHRAERNGVELIAFAAPTAADVDAIFARVQASGARVVRPPSPLTTPGGGYGFRFFSPDGLPFEVSSDVARGSRREIGRFEGLPVKISHIVMHSPDHKGLVKFMVDALGFRVSDWLGDFMCFLRCNSAHHRVAILPGPPCLNHVAYDMTGLDGMMAGITRLRQAEVNIAWGPGRHTAGDNTFSYFVSPGGFTIEYTAELEEVDEATWQAKVYEPAPRVMDQWGIGVGGPQTLPHAAPDPGLFRAVEI